jgi:hypothetical protein
MLAVQFITIGPPLERRAFSLARLDYPPAKVGILVGILMG